MAGAADAALGERYRSVHTFGARRRQYAGRTLLHLIAVGLSFILMVPFAWAVISSLKPWQEIRLLPPTFWPSTFMWSNYSEVWTTRLFPNWAQNTFLITILATLGTVITAALAGYAFGRFRFPGRGILFGLTLSTMMLPQAVTLVPSYLLFFYLGWLNTYYPLIVPFWFGGGAFFIFLFRQFFMTIPTELDDAAKIDGASYLQILTHIVLPLSLPVFATVGIIAFIAHYDSFLFPLIILNDPPKFTLSIGLRWFSFPPQAEVIPRDHLLLAMAVMMTIPIVLIFFFGQRYLVRGLIMSGIKG